MNRKFSKTIATAMTFITLASSAPLSLAAPVLSPAQFSAKLKTAIGDQKGLAAANAAAKFLGTALKKPANKRNADKYMKTVLKALRKPVRRLCKRARSTMLFNAFCPGILPESRSTWPTGSLIRRWTPLSKACPPAPGRKRTAQLIVKNHLHLCDRHGIPPVEVDAYGQQVRDRILPFSYYFGEI